MFTVKSIYASVKNCDLYTLVSGTLDPSQVQSIGWFAHSTGSPRFKPLCVAGCHWRFGLWDCIRMCSRSIVFEVVVDTIIRGLFFPHFLCITQVPPIAPVRGSLCGHDVVRSGGACFVCDLGQVPRFPNRIHHSHCLLWG